MVYSRTSSLILGDGEEGWFSYVWQSEADGETGVYAVLQETKDAYGDRQVRAASFIIAAGEGVPVEPIYLPLVMKGQSQ